MTFKEVIAAEVREAQVRAVNQHYILNGPSANTHSATMPAYAFTAACPDKALREPVCKLLFRREYGKKD
jgi:hypothetical protein